MQSLKKKKTALGETSRDHRRHNEVHRGRRGQRHTCCIHMDTIMGSLAKVDAQGRKMLAAQTRMMHVCVSLRAGVVMEQTYLTTADGL